MNRWRSLSQLFLARLREFYREPEAIFWVYGFPLLLAIGLGIAFSGREPEPPAVDVQDTPGWTSEATELVERLQKDHLPAELHDEAACRQRFRTGKTALYVVPEVDTFRYEYDPARPESLLARSRVDGVVTRWKAGVQQESTPSGQPAGTAEQHWKAGPTTWTTAEAVYREPGNRYIDFLMPGLIGLNLMGGGLWGIGFVLVDMRVRKLLKRLLATPMRREDFLLSILGTRLVFMLPEMLFLLGVGWLIFGVPIRGNVGTLILVILAGSLAFSGLGLLIACRAEKTETVSGLMNLVMLPMWLLSGTFFSSRRFPEVVQPLIQALPLTQVNDGLREVMLEGNSLASIGWRLGILAAWAVVCFLLALKWFRWR
jgi:hypothetical protein